MFGMLKVFPTANIFGENFQSFTFTRIYEKKIRRLFSQILSFIGFFLFVCEKVLMNELMGVLKILKVKILLNKILKFYCLAEKI